MNNPYATHSPGLEPESDFSMPNTPSVAQAANDLRAAAGEKIKDLSAQAANLKEKAIESASHFRDMTTEKATQFKEIANEQWGDTRIKAIELHQTAEDYIREHPTKCVLGALGVGFLIGLIVRR